MRVSGSRRLPVPLLEGFDYITDSANWPEFWPGLVRVEPGSRWTGAGDVTRIVVRLVGREVPIEMTLQRIERPGFVEYTSRQPGLPDARHERHFGEDDGALRFRIVIELEPRGLYDRTLVRAALARTVRRTLANLDGAFRDRQAVR
jgi:uncharacterized protein YndB with AHSA1/START domain